MKLKKKHRYLFSILSGLLLTLSFPYTGSLYPLAFIAWIPLLIVEHDIFEKKQKARNLFIHAFITFLIYNVLSGWWFTNLEKSLYLIILLYLVVSLVMTLVFYLFHQSKKLVGRRFGTVIFVAIWIGYEFLQYNWQISYPLLTLGNVFGIAPQFVQWYSITGVLGGSLWILLINIIGFSLAKKIIFEKQSFRTQWKFFLSWCLTILLPALISLGMYSVYQETHRRHIEVVLTQPNLDPYKEKYNIDKVQLTKNLHAIVHQAEGLMTPKTDLVLAPETSYSLVLNEHNSDKDSVFEYLQNWVNKRQVMLGIGAGTYIPFPRRTRYTMRPIKGTDYFYEKYDSFVLLKPKAYPNFKHKSKLVTGAEQIPFIDWFPSLSKYGFDTGALGGVIGTDPAPRTIHTADVAFAPLVCYEVNYGEYVSRFVQKNAEALFIIADYGLYGNSAGYLQFLSQSRLRAIETRRDVATSTNTGISCIINQKGDVVQKTGYGISKGIRGKVHLNRKKTFYVRYGDFLGRGALIVVVILTLYGFFRRFVFKVDKPHP